MNQTKSVRIAAIGLSAIFCLVNWWVLDAGIRFGGDSMRYIEGADDLLQGRSPTSYQTTFLGYIAVVALCKFIGAGLNGVIVVQLVFAALAGTTQYALGKSLVGRWCGFVSAGLLVANLEIALWNGYILTESLYTSLVVITIWFLHQSTQRKGYWYAGALFIVVFAASLRPHGWVLLPISALYWILSAPATRSHKTLMIVGCCMVAVLAFFVLPPLYKGTRGNLSAALGAPSDTSDAQENLVKMMSGGVVVWGENQRNLTMPPAPTKRTTALSYFRQHPAAVIRLFATRVLVSFDPTRAPYSLKHNALLAVYYVSLYLFAIIGLVRLRTHPLAQLIAAVIAAHLLFIALTWADVGGRFLNYVLPLMILLSACGITTSYAAWQAKTTG